MLKSSLQYSVVLTYASLLLSTTSHAAMTETFKLTAPIEFSEEGTYLTTNKGDFALQTMMIKQTVSKNIGSLKRGNCFQVISAQGLSQTDGDAISKINKVACSR